MNLGESRDRKIKIGLNIVAMCFALYSMSNRSIDLRSVSFFEKVLIESFAPVQNLVAGVQQTSGSYFEHYLKNVEASHENERLKKQIKEYEEKIFVMKETKKENQRLKNLFDFIEPIAGKKVVARVVAQDASSDYQVIRINRGAKDGITLQSPVVTYDGVVGYVFRLTANFSDVLTILDTNHKIDVLVTRTRTHGILEGASTDACLLKYVARTEPLILGDMVITSGLGNLYPKGLRIGRITRIERESYGITQHVQVQPSVSFDQLEEVAVLVGEERDSRVSEWQALDQSDLEEN